jgi:Ca2+-binding RTX toxin-like protein
MTRSGYMNAYSTSAPACSPSSWPRFHHDNANSGYFERDAVSPGKPEDAQVSQDGSELTFTAPGDDLLCGTIDHYEAVTSGSPITAQNFDSKDPLDGEPTPVDPGQSQTYDLPGDVKRFVAIRAVDEQGNVGRIVVVDRGVAGILPGHCANGIVGDDDPNTLTGTAGRDQIRGLGGDDLIRGKARRDCVEGDADNDELHGGSGPDELWGDEGNDEFFAVGGNHDAIHCGPGDDTVHAGRNDNVGSSCEHVTRGS